MELEKNTEFTELIGTHTLGEFLLGKYKVTFEKEIIRLHLQIDAESPEYQEMGEPSQEEIRDKGFKKSEKDQETFFRGRGREIVIETLIRVGGIEEIKKLGCGAIPNSFVSYSKFVTVLIKDIRERN